MPFSDFIIKGQNVELRDSQLMDLIEFMDSVMESFLQSQELGPAADWLSDAIREWKKECEMPPGCKVIRTDKWLTTPQKVSLFAGFLYHIEKLLQKQVPSAPLLLADVVRIKQIVEGNHRV